MKKIEDLNSLSCLVEYQTEDEHDDFVELYGEYIGNEDNKTTPKGWIKFYSNGFTPDYFDEEMYSIYKENLDTLQASDFLEANTEDKVEESIYQYTHPPKYEEVVWLGVIKKPHWSGREDDVDSIPTDLTVGSTTWVTKENHYENDSAYHIEDMRYSVNFDRSCFKVIDSPNKTQEKETWQDNECLGRWNWLQEIGFPHRGRHLVYIGHDLTMYGLTASGEWSTGGWNLDEYHVNEVRGDELEETLTKYAEERYKGKGVKCLHNCTNLNSLDEVVEWEFCESTNIIRYYSENGCGCIFDGRKWAKSIEGVTEEGKYDYESKSDIENSFWTRGSIHIPYNYKEHSVIVDFDNTKNKKEKHPEPTVIKKKRKRKSKLININ